MLEGAPIEVFVNRKNNVSVGDFSKNYFKLNDIQIKTVDSTIVRSPGFEILFYRYKMVFVLLTHGK